MRTIIFMLLTSLIIGCNSSQKDRVDSEIIVRIGSDAITKDELNDDLNRLSLKQKSIYTSSPEKLSEFLQTRINEKVLYKEAVKSGIQNREDIQENIDNYRKKLVTKTLGKEILQELDISQDEIKEYFDQNTKDYERVDISKIAVRLDTNAENPKESALARAELISKRASQGESFEELAMEFSDDMVTKKKGGKVGYISRGRFPSNIESVIFSLKEGEVTKPFEVDGGYLIIKANRGANLPPYNQIERTIRSKLINERLLDYINSLREEWGVQVYEERLEEMSKSE
jgi:parvulin-like peptidyl-prolyl isomerase